MRKLIILTLSLLLLLNPTINVNAENTSIEQKIINIVETSTSMNEQNELLSRLLGKNKNTNNLVSINNVVEKKEIQLKNNKTIRFLSNGAFIVETISSSKINCLSSSNYTDLKTKTADAYGPIGNFLWEAWVTGYFEYDNVNTPVAYQTDAGYRKGVLSLWQVSNWGHGAKYYHNINVAECYAKGNFHWGIEYDGNGLTIQDEYVNITIFCDKNGNVY